jgi:hypothetical protein
MLIQYYEPPESTRVSLSGGILFRAETKPNIVEENLKLSRKPRIVINAD